MFKITGIHHVVCFVTMSAQHQTFIRSFPFSATIVGGVVGVKNCRSDVEGKRKSNFLL